MQADHWRLHLLVVHEGMELEHQEDVEGLEGLEHHGDVERQGPRMHLERQGPHMHLERQGRVLTCT